jgi:hypothetical protein
VPQRHALYSKVILLNQRAVVGMSSRCAGPNGGTSVLAGGEAMRFRSTA